MDDYEKRIRQGIAQTLGDMAESVIRRAYPYDRMPLQPEAMPVYIKYVQYLDEMEPPLKERLAQVLIVHARFLFLEMAGIHEAESFNCRHPEYVETIEDFKNWILQKEGPQEWTPRRVVHRAAIPLTTIIKRIMGERMPEFRYDKALKTPGMIPFSKPLLGDNKLCLVVDRGSWRKFLSFMIAVDWPRSYFDIATFFSMPQSCYRYEFPEDVAAGTNKALDIMQILLPEFVDRVQKVLEKG